VLSRLLTIREQIILGAVPVAVVLGAAVLLLVRHGESDEPVAVITAPDPAPSAPTPTAPVPIERRDPESPEPVFTSPPAPPERVGVAIRGAVVRPGLYYLHEGQRVQDLLTEAGGATERADLSDINISAHLLDATTLTIPEAPERSSQDFRARTRDPVPNPTEYTISGWRPGPAPGNGATSARGGTDDAGRADAASGLVNVNTASASALEGLPGIGQVLAQRIIDARTEAPFSSVEDLARVRGIGDKTVASLRPYVCVR